MENNNWGINIQEEGPNYKILTDPKTESIGSHILELEGRRAVNDNGKEYTIQNIRVHQEKRDRHRATSLRSVIYDEVYSDGKKVTRDLACHLGIKLLPKDSTADCVDQPKEEGQDCSGLTKLT